MNISKLVRANILEMKAYSSARNEFSGTEGIFLDANENPFGGYNRYPDPFQNELKQTLSKLKGIDPANIFIGNGSDEIIDLSFRIFCDPGTDKALGFSPSYGMYQVSAAINNIEYLNIPLNANFQIDWDGLNPYLKQEELKLIFLCSPNNPTGNLIDPLDIEKLLKRFNGIVIVDEAYIDFSEANTMLNKIDQFENLIVIQTLSKAWGLAALRIGVAYTNRKIIEYFNKIKPPYNVSRINQEKAIEILNQSEAKKEKVELLVKERNRLKSNLEKLKLVEYIYPSDANFLLVKVKNAADLYETLIKRKIIVRNRTNEVQNCLRISIGTPQENDALIDILKSLE